MKIAIIGSKAADSLEANLDETFHFHQHECQIFDIMDRSLTKNKYGLQLDAMARHFFDKYDKRLFTKLARQVTDYMPDLTICVYRFIHPVFVTYIKENTQSIVVHFNPDALTTFEYQQVFASDYDVWFTKDQYIVRFMRNNMKLNAILYQEAFNPRLHPKPNITKAEAEKESGIDICTYGTIYPYRSRMLNQIIQAGLNITIYGTKPNRFYDSKLDKAFTNKYITGKEKAKVLYGSKIVFNQMHYAEIESMNNRFFEANGCGAFQLVDYRPILHEILPISPELVSFKSIDEGIEKIKYYLGKSQERHEIASKIYNHFINHFSYDHLIKHILSNI